jgi:putative ABC transport system permease protein
VILEESDNLRNTIAIKLSGNSDKTVEQIKSEYQKIFPQEVFTYQYVDEQIAELYKQESLQQKMIWVASSIAIFISTLGLLGLISLVTLQRTKEIGIRKVLGASVTKISLMLSKESLTLVILALLIASVLSWWAMDAWLQSFAYRIEIQWWMFGLGGGITIIISLLTISMKTIKAAMANPVESLRTE